MKTRLDGLSKATVTTSWKPYWRSRGPARTPCDAAREAEWFTPVSSCMREKWFAPATSSTMAALAPAPPPSATTRHEGVARRSHRGARLWPSRMAPRMPPVPWMPVAQLPGARPRSPRDHGAPGCRRRPQALLPGGPPGHHLWQPGTRACSSAPWGAAGSAWDAAEVPGWTRQLRPKAEPPPHPAAAGLLCCGGRCIKAFGPTRRWSSLILSPFCRSPSVERGGFWRCGPGGGPPSLESAPRKRKETQTPGDPCAVRPLAQTGSVNHHSCCFTMLQ